MDRIIFFCLILFSFFSFTKQNLIKLQNSELQTNCDIYEISKNPKINLTSVNITYIKNLCNNNLQKYYDTVILTEYNNCSPESKEEIAYQIGALGIIIHSNSIVEDVLWNTVYNFKHNISVFMILSDCEIEKEFDHFHRYEIILKTNNDHIYIICAIFFEIWNTINGLIIIYNIKNMDYCINPLFVTYLMIEFFLFFIRIFLFVEPLPFAVFHTYMSYCVVYNINFTISLCSIFFICYCLLESLHHSKMLKKTFLPEYHNSFLRNIVLRFKIPLAIIFVLFIFTFVISIIKGSYIQIESIEKLTLVFNIIGINIIFMIYIWTHVEIKNSLKFIRNANTTSQIDKLIFKITNCGVGIVIILIGTIIYALVQCVYDIMPFKVITLWFGFLYLSSANISICTMVNNKPKTDDKINDTFKNNNISIVNTANIFPNKTNISEVI